MSFCIRAETVADYAAIAGLTYEAFVNWHPAGFKAEPLLVDVLRHNPLFDPELSLVAERDGDAIGHALFSPFEAVLLGASLRGVILAPLCVAPDDQRSGIGRQLLQRGHELAAAKGYAFSLLCGHPSYYPRFGYRQQMFSLSGCRVSLSSADVPAPAFGERPLRAADLAWVRALWRRQHANDELAFYPGETLSAWCSHSPKSRSSVITLDDEPVALVCYRQADPLMIGELLMVQPVGGDLLAWLLREHCSGALVADIAQSAEVMQALLAGTAGLSLTDTRAAYEAFMLRPLSDPTGVVEQYCARVAAGDLAPGILAFPPTYALDE